MTAAAVTTSAGVSKGIYAAFGLSPLTRGTHALYEIFRTDNWFIPATAGNTTAATSVRTAATVYPRYRGEHTKLRDNGIHDIGLSPLPRGTRAESRNLFGRVRFIPATAGNTPISRKIASASTVYPRYRGEHCDYSASVISKHGLSPLPRGTLNHLLLIQRSNRFIPATAGNTYALLLAARSPPVYPRYRGGTQHQCNTCPGQMRFIPATAGNTSVALSRVGIFSVYPRYRGEHSNSVVPPGISAGLSPLPRGTHQHTSASITGKRFIPATAGNTAGNPVCGGIYAVYPRYRGEHEWQDANEKWNAGLSPLPRGTLNSAYEWRTAGRFIPATAGNTCAGSLCHPL